MAGPVPAHVAARGKARAAQAHQGVHSRFERSEEHLVPDIGAFAAGPPTLIDQTIDAADASDRRIGEIPYHARHTVGRQRGRDIGEDQDVS